MQQASLPGMWNAERKIAEGEKTSEIGQKGEEKALPSQTHSRQEA